VRGFFYFFFFMVSDTLKSDQTNNQPCSLYVGVQIARPEMVILYKPGQVIGQWSGKRTGGDMMLACANPRAIMTGTTNGQDTKTIP